ncbi:MAG: glycine--tRNA ligase subunit beta [Rhodocyclaceae bacterium]|nr:glycine--tRNA ligase subunit beta [Rhodocyclaceae bacterium]
MKNTLLIELLTEELPPKSLEKLGIAFREQMQKSLSEAGFIESSNGGRGFATPRRLAVQFEDCLSVQPDRMIEKKGPAVASGVDATGKPTKALEGFCRSAGIAFEQLEQENGYFVARLQKTGEPLEGPLAALVEAALKKLPVAKVMRWGSGTAQFVRPVHGLVMLHGDKIVPGEVLTLASGRTTRGHRFMSAGEIVIHHANDYESVLEKEGRVVAEFSRRREMIRDRLDTVAAGRAWLQDEGLLNEVTALVEYPAVYEVGFEPEFLAVPQECLILTMKANQKYFPLMEGHQLTNRFLVVSNMDVADPSNIIEGNARVVRPRLADARFFFETDKKTPLSARLGKLSRVVYHNKLGTQGDRVDRLVKRAATIAGQIGADVLCAERAALLSKADLVTDMVGEFPELQGIMGRYYALADGETAEVAKTIETHYYPRFAGDSLPQGPLACAVALADKLDAIQGFFSIGEKPTGDKDPFGLRRAALGILRILIETPLPLSLDSLMAEEEVLTFFFDRLRGYLKDRHFPPNEIDAVVCQRPMRLDRLMDQMEAVHAFVHLPEAASLAAANKRVANILRKAEEAGESFDDSGLTTEEDPAESSLREALSAVQHQAETRFAAGDFAGYLAAFSVLKEPVDTFFSEVMVMVDDPAIRVRRLVLLRKLRTAMNRFADLSKL